MTSLWKARASGPLGIDYLAAPCNTSVYLPGWHDIRWQGSVWWIAVWLSGTELRAMHLLLKRLLNCYFEIRLAAISHLQETNAWSSHRRTYSRCAHADACMLWDGAPGAATYSRQLQRQQYSRRKSVPPPPQTCINPSPLLRLGTDLRHKCHSTSQLHTGTEGKQSPCAHPAYLLYNQMHTFTGLHALRRNTQTAVQHGTSKLDTCTQNTLKHSEPERSALAHRAHTHWHQCFHTFYRVAGKRKL